MTSRLQTTVSTTSSVTYHTRNYAAEEENAILNTIKEGAGEEVHPITAPLNLSQVANPSPQTTSHHLQPFSCFMSPDDKSSIHFWKTPVKFFHIAARELSVLLILIETLILLGGYLMILGVHHSIRYCLSKLRHKNFAEHDISYMNMRNYYNNRPVIARRVPRGRMAGG